MINILIKIFILHFSLNLIGPDIYLSLFVTPCIGWIITVPNYRKILSILTEQQSIDNSGPRKDGLDPWDISLPG